MTESAPCKYDGCLENHTWSAHSIYVHVYSVDNQSWCVIFGYNRADIIDFNNPSEYYDDNIRIHDNSQGFRNISTKYEHTSSFTYDTIWYRKKCLQIKKTAILFLQKFVWMNVTCSSIGKLAEIWLPRWSYCFFLQYIGFKCIDAVCR